METKTKWILGGLAVAGAALWVFKKRPTGSINRSDPVQAERSAFIPEGKFETQLLSAIPEKGKLYAPLFLKYAEKHDLSPFLIAAIADHESQGKFDPKAIRQNYNPKTGKPTTKDYGLMQINETTLPALNEGGKLKWDNPEDNVKMATKYLRQQINSAKALPLPEGTALYAGVLAYNLGFTGLKAYLRTGKDPLDSDYWKRLATTFTKFREFLPYEFLHPKFALLPAGRSPIPLNIRVAANSLDRARGLSNRVDPLLSDEGMLFVFNGDDTREHFTMRETYIPLDLIYIDDGGKVVDIYKYAQPLSLPNIVSKARSRYVLEVRSGFADQNGIKIGDQANLSDVKRLFP